MAAVISVKNLTYEYNVGTPSCSVALDSVSLDIEKGDFIGLIGHTGSGKSTLVQHLNGLIKPTKGTVFLNGNDIHSDKKATREARFKVGLCFQYPEYQLFEETVAKDIAFGPRNMKLPENEITSRVVKAAMYVGLKKEHMEKSPFDLSGGEKRRAAIAGVMAMEPEVLILDEPTAGLDPKGREVILSLVKNYQTQTGCTVILVSHSMEDIARVADKVIVMNKGRVEMYGDVKTVYADCDRLSAIGLNVPQVTKVFSLLKEKGLEFSDDVYTVGQGFNVLSEYIKRRDLND